MKAIRLTLTLVIFIACSTGLFSQKKFDKALSKADRSYNSGNYEKAIAGLNKFKKSVTSKLGQNNSYMPGYYVRDAKFNLAYGILTNFESSLSNAVNQSAKSFGDNTVKHAGILLDVAEILNQYGYYRLSREYANRAGEILSTAEKADLVLKSRYILISAEAMIGQGFCNQALSLLRQNESFFASRAVDKETFVEAGKIASRKVPEEELASRFSSYAKLLTLRLLAYGNKGDIDSVEIAHLSSRPWLSKNVRYMSESSLALVQADFAYTQMYAENNDGIPPPGLPRFADYAFQIDDIKRIASPAVPLAHEIYLAYLDQLQLQESRGKYGTLKAEYERMLSKYFPKSSLLNINLKAVEFDAKLAEDKTKTLESDALAILNSSSLPKFYSTRIRTIDFIYEVSIKANRYSNAETYLNQLTEAKKELYGENSPEYHLARVALANFYLDYTNKIDVAGKIYDESYSKILAKEIAPKHKDHLTILNHLASYYELTDKYALASKTLNDARDIARVKYDNTDGTYAIALNQMAKLRLKIGDFEKAESDLKTALEIFDMRKNNDDKWKPSYINTIETQAKLYGIKGMFDEAQSNLDRAKKMISKSKGLITNDLSTAEELSSLYIQLGKYSETDRLLNKLITEYQRLYGGQSIRLIDPFVNRGRILLANGDYTEAQRVASQVNQLALKTYTETSTKSAPTQKLLSDIYYNLGDYDKAEENIIKAIASQEKQFGRTHVEVAKSLSQLALIKFYKNDDPKEVEKLMIEARDIMASKLGKDNPQYAEILKNMAVLYIHEKKFDIAFGSLTIAETIWKQKAGSKNNINVASIYTLTGDVYYQQRNYPKSEEFYNRSKDLYEKFFSSSHPEYVKVLSKLSKVYYMQKDYKRSKRNIEESLNNYENFIKQFFPALSEREKAKYWNTIKGDFEFYNTLAFGNLEDFKDLLGKVYNYQLLTKALLLSSSIKIRERILKSTDEELKNKYNTWVQKKELMTIALSMSPQQLLENEIDPNALAQEVERLEKELSQKSELFGQNFENKKITYEDVRKSLKPNEVAIEMVRYRYFDHALTDSVIYAALYLTSEMKRPSVVLMKDGPKMEGRYLRSYRNAMIAQIPDNISYRNFWEPIQKELGQAATIYLSADGVYNQINLESLATPDGKYIIDNSNIVMVSNTKDLYVRKIKSREIADNTASMFGNPAFYLASTDRMTVAPLPGTEREINQLQFLLKQKGWNTQEFVEQNATEEKIKELNSPKVFHVATHGFYKPTAEIKSGLETDANEAQLSQNPLMRNGLLLKGAGDLLNKTEYNYNMENGILTAYEAMSLNLDKTDLVVLSACETGLGELQAGEGVFGLQRSFLVAGAKVLVMSMFKVDDEATQKLMLKFYQKFLNSGNIRQSFIDAKKELRIDYPEPIYWGAFMMIGLD